MITTVFMEDYCYYKPYSTS